mmetsp:Transcript_52283/g.78105  ORF Transcript_52283/g.78105 Transcript_52283/m.78105 type:complete len:88 (-) Transcript_52283:82-345(-)
MIGRLYQQLDYPKSRTSPTQTTMCRMRTSSTCIDFRYHKQIDVTRSILTEMYRNSLRGTNNRVCSQVELQCRNIVRASIETTWTRQA